MPEVLKEFAALLGPSGVLTGDAARPYETPVAGGVWQESLAVLRPASTGQVAAIVRLCADRGIAIVPQGGNTNVCGSYAARIEYDDEDGTFTGQIAGIRDRVGFHSDTEEGLREAFHEAVEDYIETCAQIGKVPQ